MKILHTSDLHIGKRLERLSRLEEQSCVLSEIVDIVREEGVGLTLIAGDVFDNQQPTGEAEELFYNFISSLSRAGSKVAIIPGNHDDASKLCASDPLAEISNIYMLGELCASRRRGVEDFGTGFIRLNVNGESAVVAYLPYPIESRIMRELGEVVGEEGYSQRIGRWFSLGASAFSGSTVNLGLSHLFVGGSLKSGDEQEIELGTLRLVDKSLLPMCDYLALGHVHRAQKIGNAYYSGAILQYCFDDVGTLPTSAPSEGDKSVYLLNASAGKEVEVIQVPLSSGKRLVRLEATTVAEADSLIEQHSNKLIELTLRLTAPLTESESRQLAKPHVAKRRLILPELNEPAFSQKRRTPREIFVSFYQSRYGKEPSEELIAIYLELFNQ